MLQAVQNENKPYGYTGEWYEGYINLLHLRARWYLAETGTFLSKDVWEGNYHRPQTFNGWSYVEGNPTNFIDPSGRCRGLTGWAFEACAATVLTLNPAVQKANEYRQDIFFPSANTTFMDRLEASTVVGGGPVLLAGGAYLAPSAFTTGSQALYAYGGTYVTGKTAAIIGGAFIAANFADEATMLYGAFTGDQDDIRDAIFAQQIGASDGSPYLPFSDVAAAAMFLGNRGVDRLPSCPGNFFFPEYKPGQGFSGVYDPVTDKFIISPSPKKRLAPHELPPGWVTRNGGHGYIAEEYFVKQEGAEIARLWGFTITFERPGQLRIASWFSVSINFTYHEMYDVAEDIQPKIINALQRDLGWDVNPEILHP